MSTPLPPAPHNRPQQPSILSRAISGSLGSALYLTVLNPLEVVKVRQQTSSLPSSSTSANVKAFHRGRNVIFLKNGLALPKAAFPCLLCPGPGGAGGGTSVNHSPLTKISARFLETASMKSRGILGTLRSILRTEGVSGLWAGLSPALAAAVPNTAIYFTMYDELSIKLRDTHMKRFSASEDQARRQIYIPLLAASAARFVSSVATAPLELIKIRQANSIGHERTFIEDMRLVAREKGPAGLFRGVGSTILRDVPFSAVLFLTIETIKTSLHDMNALGARGARFYEDRGLQVPAQVQLTEALVSAFGGGVVAVLATTPFDLVKTIQQARSSCSPRLSTFGVMHNIIRKEGIPGLYRGNCIRLLKVAPGCAITIGTYELGKRFLGEI